MEAHLPGPLGPFRPKQIYEQVADAIRSGIQEGLFPMGSRLPAERQLAHRYGVSRPAVREAIGALQNEGMVATRHGSGSYVTSPVPSVKPEFAESASVRHADLSPVSILDVRMLIEPAIVKLASRHGKRDAAAEYYLEQMASVHDISDPEQQKLWSDADRLFHRQLAYMSQDVLVMKIADEISQSMDQPLWNRLRDDGIYEPERIKLYVAEHRLIYESVARGEADAAAFYIEQHLKRVRLDIAPND